MTIVRRSSILPSMVGTVGGQAADQRQGSPSREVPWAPVVVATCVSAPALALSALMWLTAMALWPSLPAELPPHVSVLEPSGQDITVGVLSHTAELLAGVVLLALTWIYGLRGRAKYSWIFAIAACVVSIATVL